MILFKFPLYSSFNPFTKSSEKYRHARVIVSCIFIVNIQEIGVQLLFKQKFISSNYKKNNF